MEDNTRKAAIVLLGLASGLIVFWVLLSIWHLNTVKEIHLMQMGSQYSHSKPSSNYYKANAECVDGLYYFVLVNYEGKTVYRQLAVDRFANKTISCL